jgi:hypothetical protein
MHLSGRATTHKIVTRLQRQPQYGEAVGGFAAGQLGTGSRSCHNHTYPNRLSTTTAIGDAARKSDTTRRADVSLTCTSRRQTT